MIAMLRDSPESRPKLGKNYKIILAVFILTGFLLTSAAVVFGLQIKQVSVSGNIQYTEEEIIDFLFDGKWDYHTVYCYYKYHTKPHKNIPFVQDYKLIFQGLGEVEIIVYEKNIIGCIEYLNSYLYFDRDGIIVESSGERIPQVPLIVGLSFEQVVLYQPLPVESGQVFDDIMSLTQMLEQNELEVDRIVYDSRNRISLMIGEVKVNLGFNDDLTRKIIDLKSLVTTLPDQKGVLSMEKYNENGYTFTPKE